MTQTTPTPDGPIVHQILDPAFLHSQLEKIKEEGSDQIPAKRYDRMFADLEHAQASPVSGAGPEDGGQAYLPRSPAVSLLQSTLTDCITSRLGDLVDPLPPGKKSFADFLLREDDVFRKFGPCDAGWVESVISKGLSLFDHKPAFVDEPPTVTIADNARLVVVGDWGTGLAGAQAVGAQMAAKIAEGKAAGREVHALHLGDVYYSGWKEEYEARFMPFWPVRSAEEGVDSWALNGNHDMYCGGDPYFEYLLGGDERFARQRSADGAGSSFFDIVSDDWRIVGLDSSWQDDILRHAGAGELAGNQAAHVEQAAAKGDGRKLLLLTHHQYVSAYEQIGSLLGDQLAPALASGRVRAWMWGHEHRCLTYDPRDHLPFAACIGHGGVPQIAHAEKAPLPAPGQWEFRGQFESGGRAWTRYGFAVLDFDGPAMSVTFVDELGQTRPPITVV